MCEHTSVTTSPETQTSPAHGSNRPPSTMARPKSERFASSLGRLLDPIRGGRRSAAKPAPGNEHSGSLRYEHVHRIEITISLLAGGAGRVRKQ
jgi:hypothetical protein